MTLIFIHGSGGPKNSWYYQSNYFEDSDTVSLPGHPDGQLLSSVEKHVEWLRDYLRDKGYQDVVLAGHSLGGATALMYALKYPQELKAIIVMSAGAKLKVHPKILTNCEKAVEDRKRWAKGLKSMYDRVDPSMRETLLAETIEIGPEAQLNDFLCTHNFDIMDRLDQINLPTLVMCGSDDNWTPPKYTRYLAEKIEGARGIVIEGGTHLVAVEKPKEVTRAIEEFLHSL